MFIFNIAFFKNVVIDNKYHWRMANLKLFLRQNKVAFHKTASYYVLHIAVAACVAYAVTGNLIAAITLSLLEPSAQAVAYFFHDKAWAKLRLQRMRVLVKTASYYMVHIGVAASVTFAVTGDLLMALTLSLLEPTVQMFFFYAHEKFWDQRLGKSIGKIAAA